MTNVRAILITLGNNCSVGTIYSPDLPKIFRISAGFKSSGRGSRVLSWLHFMYTKDLTLGNKDNTCLRRSSDDQVNGSFEEDLRPPVSSDFGTPDKPIDCLMIKDL